MVFSVTETSIVLLAMARCMLSIVRKPTTKSEWGPVYESGTLGKKAFAMGGSDPLRSRGGARRNSSRSRFPVRRPKSGGR